jgi:hypothetical protein
MKHVKLFEENKPGDYSIPGSINKKFHDMYRKFDYVNILFNAKLINKELELVNYHLDDINNAISKRYGGPHGAWTKENGYVFIKSIKEIEEILSDVLLIIS